MIYDFYWIVWSFIGFQVQIVYFGFLCSSRKISLDLEISKILDDLVKIIGYVLRLRMKKMFDIGMYVLQTSVDTSEEEVLECVRKDFIKLLNLQVCVYKY